MNINARIAAEAADFITRLLVTKDLKRFKCEVNIAAGTTRSYYVTPDEMSRTIKQTESFVVAASRAMAAQSLGD